NFHRGTIDVFDSGFHQVDLPNIFFPGSFTLGAFSDRQIPPGFAPFGIRNIGGLLLVTYAKQEPPDNDDDEPGPGNGFVNIFSMNGRLIRRFAANGTLNSPWGLAIAPPNFGKLSNDLLVGNFGDGRINAFNIRTGGLDGQLADLQGKPITIDGLWALSFGNGADGGPTDTLFFTRGLGEEKQGWFVTLRSDPN